MMDDVQSWWEVPSIAHFCSLFRAAFNLLDFDIEDLEEALLTDGADDTGSCLLQDLIVRLLAGCLGHSPNNTDISPFNYQMFLRRFLRQKCQEQMRDNPFNTDIDFQFLPLRTKVQIIHALCDFRLDADDVQDVLKNLESDSLRVDPLGHDANLSAYYYFYGTRLYREDLPKSANKTRAKVKRRKLKQEKVKKKRGRPSAKDKEAAAREAAELAEDDVESDKDGISQQCTWQVVCYTEEDWEKLAAQLKGSTVKEEKALYRVLAEDFLPEIPRLFAEKERLQKKRMLEFMPRRTSSRIEKLAKQREEEEKVLALEEEERKSKETEERQRRQRQMEEELWRERASSRTYECATRMSSRCPSDSLSESETHEGPRTSSAAPVGRQTNNSLASATGKIHISSSRQKLRGSQVFRATTEDLKTGMFKVLERLKNHEDAWPFLEEVSEDYAPRYYSVIRKPMDLNRMGDKLEDGSYTSTAQFRADFMRIVDNCRIYNGDGSEYTEMAMTLQDIFEKSVERFIGTGQSSDEEVAVEFPAEGRHRKKHRHRHHRRHRHHSSQSESSRDVSKHRGSRQTDEDRGEREGEGGGEEDDSRQTRDESDWDQDREGKQKRNWGRGRFDERSRHHNSNCQHDSNNERDQDWKREDFSDHSQSRDSSASEKRETRRKRDEIRKSIAKKKKQDWPPTDEDPEKTGGKQVEKRGALRSDRQREGGAGGKGKKEPLDWEEQERRDKAWSQLVGGEPVKEEEKKDVFDLDLDDAGWEGLKQGLREWGSLQKKPEKINESKRVKRMSQEEEDRWFRDKEMFHKDIKVNDVDDFSDFDFEMSKENSGKRPKDQLDMIQDSGSGDDRSLKRGGAPPVKKGAGILKNAAIHQALSIATEQTLKDINMWLDEAPRYTEFSSDSNSPSPFLSEDIDTAAPRPDDKYRDGNSKRKPSVHVTKPLVGKETGKESSACGAGAGAAKRRTTERLQPGKSKGNLISSMQGEPSSKESRSVIEWKKLTTPKLSLGSVLTSGFGVGVGLVRRHNFSDNSADSTPKDGGSSPVDREEETVAQRSALLAATLKKEREREEAEQRARQLEEEREREREKEQERKRLEEEEEDEKKQKEEDDEEGKQLKPKVRPNPTPNLSAWFKAFGAPKAPPILPARRRPELSATLDIGPSATSRNRDGGATREDIEDTPMTPGSTGSSVSEESSPSYPAPFPSPLHRSPEGQRQRPPQPYPANVDSMIRIGFYQDTTYKSPEKSSSPRGGRVSPYIHPPISPYPAHSYQQMYPPYSPAPYTPSEVPGKPDHSRAPEPPHSPVPAPSPASPSHLQIDLHSPRDSRIQIEGRSPMHAESPADPRSPMDSRLQIDTRSPIQAGSPLEAESPRLHIDPRSPMDVRSPMDARVQSDSRSPLHISSPMHSQSPSDHRIPTESRSPLHANSPLDSRLQIDTRSPIHGSSPMDSRSPTDHRLNPNSSPMQASSPMDSRLQIDARSPLHSGSPVDSRSPLDHRLRSPSGIDVSSRSSAIVSPAVGSPAPTDGALRIPQPHQTVHLQGYPQHPQHILQQHPHYQHQQEQVRILQGHQVQPRQADLSEKSLAEQYLSSMASSQEAYLSRPGGPPLSHPPQSQSPFRPAPHAPAHPKHLLQQTLIKQQQEKEQQLLQQQQHQQQQQQQQQEQQQMMMQKMQQQKQQQQQHEQAYIQRQQSTQAQQQEQKLLQQEQQLAQLQHQQQQQMAQHMQQFQKHQLQQQHLLAQQQHLIAQQQQQPPPPPPPPPQQHQPRSRTPVSSFPVKKRHYAEGTFSSSNFSAPTNLASVSAATASVIVPTTTTSAVTTTSTTSASTPAPAASISLPQPVPAADTGAPAPVPAHGARSQYMAVPRSPFAPVSSGASIPRSPFTPVTDVNPRSPFTPITASLSHMIDVYPRSPFYPSANPLFNRPGSAFRESPQSSPSPAPPPPSLSTYTSKVQLAAHSHVAAAPASSPKPESKSRQKIKSSDTTPPTTTASEPSPSSGSTAFQHYATKTAAVDVSKVPGVLPGSAFNFGPTTNPLTLYSESSYLEESMRSNPSSFYAHRAASDAADKSLHNVPTAASPFPFLGHQAAHSASRATYPLAHQALMDPAYQQYLLHQGLYPAGYHHALGLPGRPPFDSIQRPPWL